VGHHLAIYPAFPYPAGDEPAILRAEVDYRYRLALCPKLLFRLRLRLLSSPLLRNLQVGRDLDIPADSNAMAILLVLINCQDLTPALNQRLPPC
jgi:hypothetical protein